MPYAKNYNEYNINKTNEWNQILALKPDNYFNVCSFSKDEPSSQIGTIIGVSIGVVVLVIIIVVCSVLFYKNHKKMMGLRTEIDNHILLASAVISDFGWNV